MERFLAGGEAIQVAGCSREGSLQFSVPRCAPVIDVTIAGAHDAG